MCWPGASRVPSAASKGDIIHCSAALQLVAREEINLDETHLRVLLLFNEARLAVSSGRRFGRNMRLWVPASIRKVRAPRRYAASKPPTGHPHSVGGASGALAVVRLRPSPSPRDVQWSLGSSGSGPIWLARDSGVHVPALQGRVRFSRRNHRS